MQPSNELQATGLDDIEKRAQELRPHYSYFLANSERILMSGHSHQAWPNVAKQGLLESYQVAATHVDHKHALTAHKEQTLKNYLNCYYNDPNGLYCFDNNTHSLLIRWLSCFDLRNNPWIVSSSLEFYSAARQFRRLEDFDIHVDALDPNAAHFVASMLQKIQKRPAAVVLSQIFFLHGLRCPGLERIASECLKQNVPLLIDVYHGTHVSPLDVQAHYSHCFLLGGGYKYMQWGEGNAFLRYPNNCTLTPALTGWFADFAHIENMMQTPLKFPQESRFAGSTQEVASRFRAAAVADFFHDQKLNASELENIYFNRVLELAQKFSELKLNPQLIQLAHPIELIQNKNCGGFLALRSAQASELCASLNQLGILCDCRGPYLRLGPAPYTLSQDIDRTLQHIKTYFT